MPSNPCRLALLGLLFLATRAVAAISIQYTLAPLGGNQYRYVYTLTNSAGSPAVQLFDIYFDTSLYKEASLQVVTPSSLHADWSEQLLSSLPGLPAAYDVLSLKGGIPAGSSITGFSVEFTWLGPGVPGAQPFQVFDPGTFQVLQSGSTVHATGVPAASPASLILIALGLALIARNRWKAPSPSHNAI